MNLFFFAFLLVSLVSPHCPWTRANNCDFLKQWGPSLRPRLHRPVRTFPLCVRLHLKRPRLRISEIIIHFLSLRTLQKLVGELFFAFCRPFRVGSLAILLDVGLSNRAQKQRHPNIREHLGAFFYKKFVAQNYFFFSFYSGCRKRRSAKGVRSLVFVSQLFRSPFRLEKHFSHFS